MSRPFPWFFALNDRPVKVSKTRDGGLEVISLDMSTGEFVRDYESLPAYYEGGRDIDDLTEQEFEALVAKHRAWIREK
jgi:hypothetical protein